MIDDIDHNYDHRFNKCIRLYQYCANRRHTTPNVETFAQTRKHFVKPDNISSNLGDMNLKLGNIW